MTTQHGSDHLSFHRNEEMRRGAHGRLSADYAEPETDEDTPPVAGPPPGTDPEEAEAEALRHELARRLGRGGFPADRRSLVRTLLAGHAPDSLVDTVRGLPTGGRYGTVQEVVEALGRHPRS